jgi:hypothetical protein
MISLGPNLSDLVMLFEMEIQVEMEQLMMFFNRASGQD